MRPRDGRARENSNELPSLHATTFVRSNAVQDISSQCSSLQRQANIASQQAHLTQDGSGSGGSEMEAPTPSLPPHIADQVARCRRILLRTPTPRSRIAPPSMRSPRSTSGGERAASVCQWAREPRELSAFEFQLFTCVDHTSGNFLASHAASAALTSTGFSCAIRWPLFTTTSVRSEQWARIGSARREVTVSQV